MSSQKESLKKKISKKSMFAASAAMMLASTSALGTANRNVIAEGTILSGGTNLDGAGRVIQFTQSSLAGFQQNVMSNIDFNSSSAQVTIGHGKNVGGATDENIDHLLEENKVTLNFVGNSVVSKDIEVATINAQGINFDTLVLQKNVTVEALNFTAASAAGRIRIGGSLTTSAGGTGVTFGKNTAGGTLTFNGAVGGENPANYTFASPIVNGGNGTLNVQTKLTATDASIATLKTTNIGTMAKAQTFTMVVDAPLNLLAGGSTISFNAVGSTFVLAPPTPQTVTFSGNLDGTVTGGGIVTLDGTEDLIVQGIAGGVGSFGARNPLATLNIIGDVTVLGGADTAINVAGTNVINLKVGSTFTDESVTSRKVAAINIGEVEGAATYILDAVNGDFALDTGGISFKNAASVLQLASSDALGNNRTITLNADLNPGEVGKGIVALNSATAGEVLTIDGANGANLGIAKGNTLKRVTFAGKGNITVIPTINAANPLSVGLEGDLILRNVNAGINYTAGTNLTVDDVNGNVDFNGQATATLNLTANSMITGTVDSTKGVGGTLNLAERIVVDGVIGGTNPLKAVNFNGTGINLTKVSNAELFTVSDRANVVAYRLMTGDVTIEGNGILSAEGRVAGSVAAGGGRFKGNVTGSGSVGVNGDFTGNVSTSATIAGDDFTGNVGTTVTFKGEGTLTTGSVGDLTDFAGNAGTVNVKDTGTLAGVTSSAGNFIGNLNFDGAANVTEGVSNIGAITLNGANGKIVNFQRDVSAASLSFTDAGTANLLGSLTTIGGVDFGVSGGTLEFSGLVGDANPDNYTFNSIIANGDTGILAVNTTLIATKPDIGKVKTINIGNAKTFTVDASAGAVNLLQAAGSTITFGDANSVFRLTTNTAQTVTFNNSLNGGADNTGIVNLNGNGNTLTLAGNTGTETLGGTNKLAELNVSGTVTISGADTKLDVSNIAVLNLAPAAVFTDKSLTSATINEINIGVAGVNGKATYVLDVVNSRRTLLGGPNFTLNASGVNFANPDSVLRLQSTAPAGVISTISLKGDLASAAGTGIVELNSVNKGANLIIYSQEKSFGTALKPLKQLIFSGQGAIVTAAKTFTPEILLNVAVGAADYVTSNITYATNTKFEVGNVTGNIDFANQAGTTIFDSTLLGAEEIAQITGNITSTGGSNGTVEFVDNGIIGTVGATTITNLKMLKAGADNSTVTINSGGNMSIDEIQGTGTGTIVFAANTDLKGGVNITGGKAVNLTFTNGGTISGDVGTGAKIGDIVLQGGETTFFGKGEGNTLYIVPGNGAKLDSRGEFNFKIVIGSPPTLHAFQPAALVTTVNDTLWIAHSDRPEIYQGDIASADMPLKTFQVDGSDITFLDTVYINNLNFTTPNSVTTNFKGIAQIGEATTIGNKIHTIAISNDITTGTSSFGSESNPLKTIQFLTDSTFTANSPSIYSTITTNTNNTGTVVFNADNGFTDDLGDSNTSLNTVQFRSVKGTVKGDVYSQNISIDSGKSAIFTGYTSRKLSVADAKVNGVFVPRSIKEFNYKTKIVADNFTGADASSSGNFSNAALIQSPIKGGSFKFEDDVWLQKPLTGVDSVTFAPKKISIIQSNLEAKKIIADQATLMFIDNNLALKGDVTGSNITLDLGNNQVTYTGNAAPSGELTINVFYDVTNSGTSNNTGSGNIVIAEGSNIDLSGVTAKYC